MIYKKRNSTEMAILYFEAFAFVLTAIIFIVCLGRGGIGKRNRCQFTTAIKTVYTYSYTG
jgi:hypothetical protein